MKLLILFALFFGFKSYGADCHGYYRVDPKAKEANIDYVVLEKNVPQKFCLQVPKDPKSKFIEITSINLGNASCSDVRMTVNPPGAAMPKLKSMGTQPGVVGYFKGGLWVVKLVLKDGCDKYKLLAKWY